MLVLTRRLDESIIIGDDVEVTIVAVAGDRVRIGIQAPREIPVFRTELYREIQQEGRLAADAIPSEKHDAPNPQDAV
jgi:carbon storage regulator